MKLNQTLLEQNMQQEQPTKAKRMLHRSNTMPATAALDQLNTGGKRSKLRTGDSPRRSSMSSLPLYSSNGEVKFGLTDLFQQATAVLDGIGDDDTAFPIIDWDSSYEERIGYTFLKEPKPLQREVKILPPLPSLSWGPGDAKVFQSALMKRTGSMARSKTMRTSFATLGGVRSQHLSRNL